MKILFVGDQHLRTNPPKFRTDDYYSCLVSKLKDIKKISVDNNVDMTISLGDMFDKTVIENLERIMFDCYEYINGWNCVIGNHDCKEKNNDLYSTSLGLLERMGVVTIPREDLIIDNVLIRFMHYSGENQYNHKNNFKGFSIACAHEYFLPSEVIEKRRIDYECFKINEIDSNFDFYALGHYHYPFDKEVVLNGKSVRFVNPGSINRISVQEGDFNRMPKVVLFDTETKKVEDIYLPSAKRWEDVFILNKDKQIESINLNSLFIDELKSVDFEENGIDKIMNIIKKNTKDNKIIDYLKEKLNHA